MKLIQFSKEDLLGIAVWDEQNQRWLEPRSEDFPVLTSDFLEKDEDEQKALYEQALADGEPIDPDNSDDTYILPPVLFPTKILCIGLNYADHAEEFKDPIPDEPVIFNKAVSSLSGLLSPIVIPDSSDRVDYEAELVVVIGKSGRHIPEEEALDYVGGYTCGNDVSARDWQKNKPAGQWFLGKSFDSFAPIGPALVLKDEIDDPNNLKIESILNGQVMQSSNTKHFIFKIQKLIAYISSVMSLEPGDLIFTGTPGGVGDQRNPPVYLKEGDTIEVKIEKIGSLVNIAHNEAHHCECGDKCNCGHEH